MREAKLVSLGQEAFFFPVGAEESKGCEGGNRALLTTGIAWSMMVPMMLARC